MKNMCKARTRRNKLCKARAVKNGLCPSMLTLRWRRSSVKLVVKKTGVFV